jgi:hypothetical protein
MKIEKNEKNRGRDSTAKQVFAPKQHLIFASPFLCSKTKREN